MSDYDCIVIGAGHAGIEAALACARLGCSTLMMTLDKRSIGRMSCNPAIGGVGKGQLVKEIDALGGQMARAADACGIQFRVLNASKGPAVQSSRAQIDMARYSGYMADVVTSQENLSVKEAEVQALIVNNNKACGVITAGQEKIYAHTVIVAPGTFLNGLIHVGMQHMPGGRIHEPAATCLAGDLASAGFRMLTFKTGTCPRIDKNSIDFSCLTPQYGDEPARPFSFSTERIAQPQLPCHITHTNERTHAIISKNLDRSPLYAGVIKATGVRYCPSIEDKIVKFTDRERHQIFLEPEGYDAPEIYPNGLSTSLPEDVQVAMIQSVRGLEKAKILRYGYGIEHAVLDSTQLSPTLESKPVKNLYFAGQINGTTGYEEAGAQGLVAGINAALRVRNKESFILDRASGYIGVLIDDLTTKGTNEPYRMFTSRVEYRLLLREDNADLRLRSRGHAIGLVDDSAYKKTEKKRTAILCGLDLAATTRVKPEPKVNEMLKNLKSSPLHKSATLRELLKRPGVGVRDLCMISPEIDALPKEALQQVEIEVKYSGFIDRQHKEVERFEHLEKIRIPESLVFADVNGLSREIREKLSRFKPVTLGQASRISGVTPAAISLLMVYLHRYHGQK